MNLQKILPPTWLLIAILAILALHFLVPGAWIVPPIWNLTGLVFLGVGLALNLVGDKTFHQVSTTIKPFEESSVLVTDGLFRMSRNPMYLGMVLILAGIAIVLRSLSPFLVVLSFAILIDRIFVKVEESMLAGKFGPKWEEYSAKTRRWL
jgi:protein-S-isoprenylcysteine O-methyltransferase Ste14